MSEAMTTARNTAGAAAGTLDDLEIGAYLQFGTRVMALGEFLKLGAGDVIALDRHVNDPVELIVGDRIMARGEVVIVKGTFALRVTEVMEPKPRLERAGCLFA